MIRLPRSLAALAVLLALAALAWPAARTFAEGKFDERAALALGHEMASHIVNNQPGPVWLRMAPKMREAMGDSTKFAGVTASIVGMAGKVDSVLDETVATTDGGYAYRAQCKFSKLPDPWTVSVSFDGDANVVGLFVRPSAANKPYASPHLDYVTKTPLHLPFRGEWTVVWGGRTVEQNYHAATRDQRFALDLLIKKDGKTHAGEGKDLADYYCYGQPIIAPAAGRVVWLQDSLADNRPGNMDKQHPTGNAIILDHGNGEYSLFAHMQPRSLRVKLGARVKDGDVIGLCGNSGNTSEPHLHYHLQDGPVFHDADGLPPRFLDLFVDGVHRDTAEVVQKQKIRRAS